MNKKYIVRIIAVIMMVALVSGCSGTKKNTEATENLTEMPTATTINPEPTGPVLVEESDEEGFSPQETVYTTEETVPETKPVDKNTDNGQNNATEPTTKPTDENEDPGQDNTTEPSTEPTTAPTEPENETTEVTEPPVSEGNGICCEYAEYLKMSPSDQQAFMESFSSPMEFINWLQQAEAEHNAHDSSLILDGGNVNIGDYIK